MINTGSIKGLGRLKDLSEYLYLDRTKKKCYLPSMDFQYTVFF